MQNVSSLVKIAHAAFDANLIGVNADFQVHVFDPLSTVNDGPMPKQGVKEMGGKISSWLIVLSTNLIATTWRCGLSSFEL